MNPEYTKRLQKIEEALHQVCPKDPQEKWLLEVTGALSHIPDLEKIRGVHVPIWDLLDRGGKRWRPLVMVLAHEAFAPVPDEFYPMTTLVELPHDGSLIVDDIEDDATERRGGPAIHLTHGVDMAINSGNHIYFLPTYLFDQYKGDQATLLQMMLLYNQVLRRLHFGQGLDIQWHGDQGFLPEVEDYLQMCRFKTGALARLSALLGATAGGASKEKALALGEIWENAGVGFQILDDVKNLSTGNPGKMQGDDFVEGKKSLPVILHGKISEDGGQSLLALMGKIIAAPKENQQKLILDAITLVKESGALQMASQKGEEMLSQAKEKLKELLQEGESLRLQIELLELFRKKMRAGAPD